LLETLRVIEAKNINHLQLLISFASPKVNADNRITNANALCGVKKLLIDFEKTIIDNVATI
jgi:chromate reductase, NAD(P)H dehydrogenase (quinone)